MKLFHLLSLAAVAQALVIPDDQVLLEIDPATKKDASEYDDIFSSFKSAVDSAATTFFDIKDDVQEFFDRPRHPPHKREPNETLYEMINRSKYTTKLAKLINDDDELIDLFNSTDSNITLFAPIDSAFEKIPDHHHKPSKEIIKKVLMYHAVPGIYDARSIGRHGTLPSLYTVDTLSKKTVPQRLAIGFDIRRGFGINYYAKLRAVNIYGTNGVAHAISSILIPPPNAVRIVGYLVQEFATLNLAIEKTNMTDKLNDSDAHHGGTLFAPPDMAWKRLGPKINAFLFSSRGLKYLKALIKYHTVPDKTLYTDAYYTAEDGDVTGNTNGLYHLDLKTGLKGKSLSVDIARFGHWTTIKINGFARVTVPNGVARDGVIQDVSSVLIPPKEVAGFSELSFWDGEEELDVEDLKERLEPYLEDCEEDDDDDDDETLEL